MIANCFRTKLSVDVLQPPSASSESRMCNLAKVCSGYLKGCAGESENKQKYFSGLFNQGKWGDEARAIKIAAQHLCQCCRKESDEQGEPLFVLQRKKTQQLVLGTDVTHDMF